MRVLRIETEDGTGAYNARVSWGDNYPGGDRHPAPCDDSRLCLDWRNLSSSDKEHYFFGFLDEAQFRSWFYWDRYLQLMDEAGLELAVYEVQERHVLIGNAQIVFIKREAELVERRSLMTYCA